MCEEDGNDSWTELVYEKGFKNLDSSINASWDCVMKYSAAEAIEKIREYEDRQKWVEEWNRKQAEQLCHKVEESEEKRSCSNCGQPREGALNQCIPFTKGACRMGLTAWIPKQAKYKYAFEDGHKFCTDNLPNEEQLMKLVREHGKVSISLSEEQMRGDKE